MKKATLQKLSCLSVVLLSSCALMIDPLENNIPPIKYIQPASVEKLYTDLANVEEPARKPVISVYANDFKDQTGQRRSNCSALPNS